MGNRMVILIKEHYTPLVEEREGKGVTANVTGDISVPRSRKSNYCQIMKKDVIVSGTVQAVTMLGGIANEHDHQKLLRTREALRDLEKSVVRGILSGSTLGSGTAYRSMKGIRSFLSTNVTSAATLPQATLATALKAAWTYGGTDIDVLAVGITNKQLIDGWNSSRVQVQQRDALYRNLVTEYDSAFGTQRVLLSRWIPAAELMGISTRRIKVLPLKNRSFRYTNVAQTGDSIKGMILGEYTVELKNEEGMARLSPDGS